MADKSKAVEAKAKGNAAFTAKNFEEAIKHFTEAISHDSSDHVFFSNRSACYASLEKYDEALGDGKECVKLKPDWSKGYTRKGLAEFWLKKYDDAAETYKAGLKLAPDDASLKEGLQKAMDAKYELPGSGAGASGGDSSLKGLEAELATAALKNPKIAGYMKDKSLMSQVSTLMGVQNPSLGQQLMMQACQKDPRVLEIIMALQGVDMEDMKNVKVMAGKGEGKRSSAQSAEAPPHKKPRTEEPPADLRDPATKEADEWKAKGNELYKKKEFEEALKMYDKAIEAQPNDLVYHNNKCAVWTEMGLYDKVIEKCKDLLERRYEINGANSGGASFEKVAKVYNRIASVYEKQKEFEKAIEYYNKALCEDNNRQTRNALREIEKAKEKFEKDSYVDTVKAEEANERAKAAFKNNDMPTAKKEYDEAVARNPKDAKLYSNRAAALTKLMAYPDALRDLDECLKLDPKFMKAYSRKGAAHFFMKEYNNALKAYDNGLKIDPQNEECKKGRDQVHAKVMETSRSGEVDEEQVRHAMADPEIQQILHDPQINLYLKQMQESPKEASQMLQKDAKLREAFNKLVTAGIVRIA